MQFRSPLRRVAALAVAVGVSLSLTLPVSALPSTRVGSFAQTAAVSAPVHPAGGYILASTQLSSTLERQQINALWNRLSAVPVGEQAQWLSLPNYQAELADRYAACALRYPGLSAADIVKKVNMGLDRPFYEQTEQATGTYLNTVLVNKYNGLPADYVPALEALGRGYGIGSLRPEAAQQFRAMADAAARAGLSLRSVSAFRSYQRQQTLYNGYLSTISRRAVDRFSARPGYSEHQTGLAVDINEASLSAHFENTAEYAWLKANCAEFGFILRYPQGKESITGYRYEPWHYRYVGREIARICMSEDLTYEEYLALQPVPEANALALFYYQNGVIDLSGEAIHLNGVHYLPAAAFVRALGGTAEGDSTALTVRLGGRECLLQPGNTVLANGASTALTSPALPINGQLYLALTDLCIALGLGAAEGQACITLYPLYHS